MGPGRVGGNKPSPRAHGEGQLRVFTGATDRVFRRPRIQGRKAPQRRFFRLDARLEKRRQFNSGAWITGTLEWFNGLMADEVDGVNYTPRGLVYQRQSALTLPSVGVEFGY